MLELYAGTFAAPRPLCPVVVTRSPTTDGSSRGRHIFLMLVFPYLLRFMPTLAGAAFSARLKWVVGCMATIGFCIKPHCFIVFAAVQLLYMARTRSARILISPENILIYAIVSLYLAAIVVFLPDYIHVVMPMALATYSSFSMRINGIFFGVAALVILGVAFADFRWRLSSPYRRDIYYLLELCLAFLFYALANNGWNYTYIPLISLTLVVNGWVLMDYLWLKEQANADGLPARQFIFGVRACALCLTAVIGCSAMSGFLKINTNCTEHLKCGRLGKQLIADMKGVHSFGSISVDFGTWARLSDSTGARWDTRFNHLWMLPKFMKSGADFAQRNRWILTYVTDALAEDMDRHKPEIMFVDAFSPARGHVDPLDYLSAFPHFRDAWQHYRYLKSDFTCTTPEKTHCGGFRLYERVNNGG